MRGDLDWIVMKCLEKDRQRRYETPTGWRADVARHLSNEPVLAVPPSLAYRFRRFAKRHRVALVTSVAFIALLAAGTVTSTWEAVRATQAERAQTLLREQAEAGENKALAEARKSQQVARFLEDMLQGVAPSVALGRDTTMLREIADRTAQRLGKDLADQPGVEADLCATVGNVYGDLGEYTNAAAMHRRALELRKKLFGAEHPDVASSLNDLAQALYGEGKWADAEATHRAALAMRRKLLGNDHVATAQSLNNLGEALRKQAEFVEAESLFREALAMRKRLLGDEHPAVAETLNNLGMLFNRQGNGKEAEPFLRDALRIRRKVRDEHPDVAQSLDQLAWALFYQGKYDEAEQTGREAVAMSRKLFGGAHPALAYSLHNLAFVLDRRGSLSEAEKLYREALAMQRELSNTENPDHMGTLILLGDTLFREGKNAEAETMFLEALAKRRNYFGDGHPALVSPLTCLARTVQRQGRPSEAEDFYRKALAIEAKETNSVGWTYMPLATLRSNLAQVLQEQGKFVEAKALTDEDAKTQTLAK